MDNNLKKRYANKGKFQKQMIRSFLSLLAKKYDSVLEVGCGKGFWSYVGARRKKFKNICGCDVFRDYQVREIKPFAKKVNYKNIIKNIFPFENDCFDLVFSMDVIEHVENEGKFISETLRVCKSGGEIIIGTPNYFRLTNLFLLLTGRLKYPRSMGKDAYGDVLHIREYKKSDILKLLKKCHSIKKDSIKIIPCWLGLLPLNIGIDKTPFFLAGLCQFWMVKFTKK